MFILEGTLKGQSGHDGAWCKGGGGGDAEQGRDLRAVWEVDGLFYSLRGRWLAGS